jgi:hypothetical protein
VASWRVAKSLETLRRQINEMAPGRSTASDGTIGDQSHQIRNSDHNPNAEGVVTALDITHDPAHGVNAGDMAEMLRLSQDPRIKYIISNRRIASSKVQPWVWRPYTGANAHTRHFHVSVMADPALYDDTAPWALDRVVQVEPPLFAQGSKRCADIVATMFGGAADPNRSAYDGHLIDDQELGVALPFRFKERPLPRVRVFRAKASVDCAIVDVGPWNTDDPYWEEDERPQAESGIDMRGRVTNGAGIDLTPAAAQAIGLPGKGKVDWEFIAPSAVAEQVAEEADRSAALLEQIAALLRQIEQVPPLPQKPEHLQKTVEVANGLLTAALRRPLIK